MLLLLRPDRVTGEQMKATLMDCLDIVYVSTRQKQDGSVPKCIFNRVI